MPDDKETKKNNTLVQQSSEGKKESTEKCSPTKTCFDLLHPLLGHSLPEDLLGPQCGGSSGRCGGQCADTNVRRSSSCTPSSFSPNLTTKIIRLPNPRELTFPSYLRYLTVAIEKDKSDPSDPSCDRFPFLMDPPPRPPHKWHKRYRIALWKGITCGGIFLTMDSFLHWLW